jgi:acetyl/propionyl-CoA carboxylase alpha subunit
LKLTVHADSRRTAIERAVAALQSYVVLGIRTNIPFLVKLLRHPDFAAGSVHTGFIDQHVEQLAAVLSQTARSLPQRRLPTAPRFRVLRRERQRPLRPIPGRHSQDGDVDAAREDPDCRP